MDIVEKKIAAIIAGYNKFMKGIDDLAVSSKDRAYGGIIRAGKGRLVEKIASDIVQIAWIDVLHQDPARLKINKEKVPIGINDTYINRIKNDKVKQYVVKNRESLIYKFGTDVQVFVDGKLVLPIECKAYTENAMLKRILFDAYLMKEALGLDTYYLVQMESQLGGDYCELNDITYGSPATHALLAHVDVDLEIITLLQGERKVNRPIHKAKFFKELKASQLRKAVALFSNELKKHGR